MLTVKSRSERTSGDVTLVSIDDRQCVFSFVGNDVSELNSLVAVSTATAHCRRTVELDVDGWRSPRPIHVRDGELCRVTLTHYGTIITLFSILPTRGPRWYAPWVGELHKLSWGNGIKLPFNYTSLV